MSGSRFFVHAGDRECPLDAEELQVGRHPACDIVVPDTTVSRRHARLRVQGEQVFIEDLGSRNGVRINHERIRDSQPVRHGDRISLGDFELILRDSTKPPPRDAKPTEPHRRPQATPVETPRADEPTQPTVYEPLLASLENAVDDGTEEGIE
ncbi:MAG: FHA domain-containing protein, partial [Polyangiales bacterium]